MSFHFCGCFFISYLEVLAWTYTDHLFHLLDEGLLYSIHKHSKFLQSGTVLNLRTTEARPFLQVCSTISLKIPPVLMPLGTAASFPLLLVLRLLTLFSIHLVTAGTRNGFCSQELVCVFHNPFFIFHSDNSGVTARASFLSLWTYIHLSWIAAQIYFASRTPGS